MTNNVVLSTRNIDDLINDIANEVISRFADVNNTPQTPQPEQDELLTRTEAMQYLRITGATLWRYEKQGKIQSIGIGGKRYFRKSEIEASLIQKK